MPTHKMIDVSLPCASLRPTILHENLVVYTAPEDRIESKASWSLVSRALSLEWDRYGDELTKLLLGDNILAKIAGKERRFARNRNSFPVALRPYGGSGHLDAEQEFSTGCRDMLAAGVETAESLRQADDGWSIAAHSSQCVDP